MSIHLNPPLSPISIDLAHVTLITGIITAHKPKQILELGYGTGYTTHAILQAIEWNQRGHLTIVDNWYDWHGTQQNIQLPNTTIITDTEEHHVKTTETNTYNILISDADHYKSEQWLDEHLRITTPGGYLFFHDVGIGTLFPNLQQITQTIAAKGLPHNLFDIKSRNDETTERGLLMVHNTKA